VRVLYISILLYLRIHLAVGESALYIYPAILKDSPRRW